MEILKNQLSLKSITPKPGYSVTVFVFQAEQKQCCPSYTKWIEERSGINFRLFNMSEFLEQDLKELQLLIHLLLLDVLKTFIYIKHTVAVRLKLLKHNTWLSPKLQ